MLKLPVKSPIVNGDIDLSEYAKKSDVDAIDASLDNKADKKEVEKISSQLDNSNAEVAAARNGFETLGKRLDGVDSRLDNIAQQATKFSNPTRAWNKSKKNNVYESWTFTNGFYDSTTNEICLAYNSKEYHTSKTGKVLLRKKKDLGVFGEAIEICDGYKCHACGINALGEYIAICQDITGEHGFDGGMSYSFKSID